MLKILALIARNTAAGPFTVPLPGSVATPTKFRGAVELDTSRCIGCGLCSYVCVSNAIVGAECDHGYRWHYEPGRCTFCARCLERCPCQALSMQSEPLGSYEQAGERASEHLVAFAACPDCGTPVRQANEALLQRAFAHWTSQTRELTRLCERCRRQRLQRNMAVGVFDDHEEKNR